MSLYYVQKYLYELNRSETHQTAYRGNPRAAIEDFMAQGADLTEQEVGALTAPDIGLLFHLGVNGQILMHFAALHQIEWQDYLQRMRDGVAEYGPVREGVYAMTGYEGTASHAQKLGQHASGETAPGADEREAR